MQQWQLRVTKARNGFGLSLTEEKDGAIFVEKVVVGGAADRCGIQPHDKIITVNRKAPRHLDEAISIVKDSNKFLDVVIAREDPDVAPASSTTEQVSSSNLLGYPFPDFPEGPEWTRKEEKESLQHLNNRLAGYIDRVRRLQTDNRSLGDQIKYMKEAQYREIQKIRERYDKEIASLKQLPETFDDLKVSSDGLFDENQELKSALLKKSDDLTKSEGIVSQLQEKVEKLSNRLMNADNEKKSQMSAKDTEIKQLQVDLSKQLGRYQNLLDVKTALDMEIAVYKELLESEEDRLGIVIYDSERTRARGPSGSSYESSGTSRASTPVKTELTRKRMSHGKTEPHVSHL